MASPRLSAVFSLNLDKAPLLQFQRFMGQKGTLPPSFLFFFGPKLILYPVVIFQKLISHLTSDKADYVVVTRPTTELSQSFQHNTLVLQAISDSSFTLSPSAITQKALGKFFEAVFHTTNHTLDNWSYSGNETFQNIVMEVLARMIETPQNKAHLFHAISEQNPTFNALIEITFRTALLENRVDLVRFLIESTKFNLNNTIPMSSGPCSPMEIALRQKDFAMTELLIDLGADPRKSFSNDYEGSLNSFVKDARPDFLQKILIKWYANIFDAPVVFWKHVGCRESIQISLEKAISLEQTQIASMRNTGEDTKSALSALKAAVRTNNLQNASMIIRLCKHRELEVMEETEDGLVFSAVEVGSMDMVRLLIKSGADVNVPGPLSVSPLTIAILDGELHIAKLLIDWGASVEGRSSRKCAAPTPLQAAACKGSYEIASILISRGADVEAVPSTIASSLGKRLDRIDDPLRLMYECSTLEIAAFCTEINSLALVQLLVESGANAGACLDGAIDHTARFVFRRTKDEVFRYLLTVCSSFFIGDALNTVIELGFMQSLQFLSEREVDTTGLSSSFQSDCSSAVNCTDAELQLEMVSRLIQQGVELKRSNNKPMRFNRNLYKSNPALAELLLQNGAYVSVFTELMDALLNADKGVEDACKTLFSASPHPTLLQDPCFGHSILVLLAESDRSDMVHSLLKWGVRVDFPCAVLTVLQICSHGTMEDLRMLLSSGAPVNLERDFECDCWDEISIREEYSTCSPLQVAARNGRTDMVEVLLQAGASVDFIGEVYDDALGFYTPTSWVYHHETDNEYTCESTLSISVQGGLEVVKMVVNAGADVNEPPHEYGGRTALQKAAQVGDMEIVEYILREQQANVNAGPAVWRGVTALQAAAINSHFDVARMLLEMGADPNAPGAEEEGRTALEGAAERGRIDMVQLLLDNGADVTSPDFGAIQLHNAVELARKEGFQAVARMLERHRDSLKSTS